MPLAFCQVVGNYFDHALAGSAAAYTKHAGAVGGPGAMLGGAPTPGPSVMLRQWTLGEVVTAAADAGLCVLCLHEEQTVKGDDAGLPKMFTLVAARRT